MNVNPYPVLRKVYVNIRNNIAHKKVDKKEKLYGRYHESEVLHLLIDSNYKSFKKFNKISRRSNLHPKRMGNLEDKTDAA